MRSNSESRWGNKFGFILLPIKYHKTSGTDPLQYVKRAKVMIDQKKQSLEAPFSYKIGYYVMSYLGSKVNKLYKCNNYGSENPILIYNLLIISLSNIIYLFLFIFIL